MKKIQSTCLVIFCSLGLTLFSNLAFAAEDPIQMLRNVTNKVMSVLKQNRTELKKNPKQTYQVANQYIVPYVDFVEMARWVVGRNAWGKADASTQQSFVEEFRTLVVRSYAQSLLNYTDQTIDFTPIRGSTDKERVNVTSFIREPGKKSIRMDYRLIRHGNSWKVYDIIIEGVSLSQGYRAQFSEEVRQGGVNAVIQRLKQHNHQGNKA